MTVYEKLREDIPNISTFHLICGSMKLCFRLLFTLINNELHQEILFFIAWTFGRYADLFPHHNSQGRRPKEIWFFWGNKSSYLRKIHAKKNMISFFDSFLIIKRHLKHFFLNWLVDSSYAHPRDFSYAWNENYNVSVIFYDYDVRKTWSCNALHATWLSKPNQ